MVFPNRIWATNLGPKSPSLLKPAFLEVRSPYSTIDALGAPGRPHKLARSRCRPSQTLFTPHALSRGIHNPKLHGDQPFLKNCTLCILLVSRMVIDLRAMPKVALFEVRRNSNWVDGSCKLREVCHVMELHGNVVTHSACYPPVLLATTHVVGNSRLTCFFMIL